MEVHLRNESVTAGIALHWHGVDVPNAMDGVAGVTQDAVPAGGEFTYRFVAEQRGTYWYHSHQVSNDQVIGGLFGALVVEPKKAAGRRRRRAGGRPHLRRDQDDQRPRRRTTGCPRRPVARCASG